MSLAMFRSPRNYKPSMNRKLGRRGAALALAFLSARACRSGHCAKQQSGFDVITHLYPLSNAAVGWNA
jgi:hypothetical protein